MGGVEYQVTKVDPTDPETKGMVYQVHKVSEEVAATLGGKVYRARIIKDPTEPTVAGKVYQIVLIGDPDDPAVKGKVYNAILTGGSEAVVVGPGVAPLDLDDAVAEAVYSLIAFGGTEQHNLPVGYTQYDSLIGDGNAYIDLDCVLDQNDEIEIDFMKTSNIASRNVFGGRDSATSNNISVIIAGTGNVVADFNNSDYAPYRVNTSMSQNTMYKVIVNKTGRYVYDASGTLVDSNTTACEDAISAPGCYVFNLAGAGLGSKFVGVVYKCVVKGKRDCVPAYNGTEYGMYDKISGRFFGNANTEGAFSAGTAVVPTPTSPIDIVCNNGVLKYSTNMANVNAQTALIGYYISSSGVVTVDANNWVYQDYIPVKPNTTYTLSFDINVYFVTISEYSTADDSGFIVRNTGASGVNTSLTITTGATTNYIRFGTNIDRSLVTLEEVLGIHWMLNPGNVVPYQPYVEGGFYVGGTQEIIRVSGNLVEFNETRINSDTWASADKTKGFEVCADVYGKNVGDSLFSNGNCFGVFVPCKKGQSVSMDFFDYAPFYSRCYYCEVTADRKVNTTPAAYAGSTSLTQKTFTLTQDDSVGFVMEWYIASAQIRNYTKENYTVVAGTTPPTKYIPFSISTAVCENLFAVGDYKDQQDVVSGEVTRKIGAKVLDGTEDWVASGNLFYAGIATDALEDTHSCYCTHFKGVATNASASYDNEIKVGTNATQTVNWTRVQTYPVVGTYSNVTAFKQWLADQYAAGTPVIVIYPLKTPVTETVTGQPMETTEGDNVAEITQASIDGLELEVEYEKEVD